VSPNADAVRIQDLTSFMLCWDDDTYIASVARGTGPNSAMSTPLGKYIGIRASWMTDNGRTMTGLVSKGSKVWGVVGHAYVVAHNNLCLLDDPYDHFFPWVPVDIYER
jgi:hypothetical protein